MNDYGDYGTETRYDDYGVEQSYFEETATDISVVSSKKVEYRP